MDILFVIIFIIFFVLYFVYEKRKNLNCLKKNGINGPRPAFFGGNLKELKQNNVAKIYEWWKEYGDTFGFYRGDEPVVVTLDKQLITLINIKDFHLFTGRLYAKNPLEFSNDPRERNNIAMQNGHNWKRFRMVMRPSFSSSKLKAMVPAIDDSSNTLLKVIEKKSAKGKEFEIYKLYKKLTMEVIGRVAFGIDTQSQLDPNDEFAQAGDKIIRRDLSIIFFSRFYFGALAMIPNIIHFILRKLNIIPKHTLYKLTDNLIKMRLQNKTSRKDLLNLMLNTKVSTDFYKNNLDLAVNPDVDQDDAISNMTHESISELNEKRVQMSKDEVVANSVFFLVAGFETTSTALAFTTHFLINYPDVQSRVREEVKDLLSKEGKLDYNTISKLPYMEAVINEAFRMYPPVTFFTRRVASVDYKYKNITIPKQTTVITPIPLLHRDERYWKDPNVFNPERFFGTNLNKANSVTFMPFGVGPRNCIGLRLAMLEIKLTLAKMLLKYKLVPGPSTCTHDNLPIITFPVIQRPKNGIFLKVIPLNAFE